MTAVVHEFASEFASTDFRLLIRFPATLIVLTILSGCVSEASAAPKEIHFDSWTTENGLPQNSVNDILQTRDGYLWLATFGGLVRFDGVRFVVFDRSFEGIGSQRVRTLHEDRHGTLWAGSEDGMLIRYRDGRFATYGSHDGLPHAGAIRIEEDDEGDLWITWIGGLTRFDGERFVNLGPDHFANRVLPPSAARYTDTWWRYEAGGLHALVNGRVHTYPIGGELRGAAVISVVPDKCGNLWITSSRADLLKATPERVEHYADLKGLPGSRGSGVFLADCADNVWVHDSRLNVYRVRNRKLQPSPFPPLLAVYEDREGSVWIGTSAAGLRRLRATSITALTERDGLSLERVYSVLEDRAGALWIGTWDAGLKKYAGGRSRSYSLADGLPSFRVTCIYEDRSGRLWVGTDKGLTSFENGRFRLHEDRARLLQGSVWAIQEDASGAFWFATDAGLVRSSGGLWTRFTTREGLTHDRTSALLTDRAGALWIGTFQGLTRYQGGAFTRYTEQDGLIGNPVRAIHEDEDGILWIGTYDGGLYRLAHERLTRYTRNDGLHDNGVFQILADDDGNFWMGSNRGISRVSRRELNEFAARQRHSITAVAFGARDGLASVEVNGGRQPAGMKARDGRLWFPTMGGVAVIDPAALRTSAKPPPAIIEEFRLTGMPIDFTRQVTIPPDAATFEIRYTAPSFVKPEQIRFRHRLVGLDSEWVEAGDRRAATFFRVSPGRYRFEVIASSHDGQWGTSGPSIEILVRAPLWRTSWFMVLAIAAGGSMVFAGHHLRVRHLRRLHELQEGFSRQLIDSQEGERQRISNEMHDALGQDLGIIRKITRARPGRASDPDSVRKVLDEIDAIAERIDAEMKEIAYGLRPHQLDTIGLSRTIESMVRRVGQACDVEFTAEISPIDDLLPRSWHIHVFRIVQEGVSNVVKHSRASHARAAIVVRAASVEIAIEDNGTGFDPEILAATHATTRSFGLVGIRERARILGGRVEIRSGAHTGTVIAVTLPLEKTDHG